MNTNFIIVPIILWVDCNNLEKWENSPQCNYCDNCRNNIPSCDIQCQYCLSVEAEWKKCYIPAVDCDNLDKWENSIKCIYCDYCQENTKICSNYCKNCLKLKSEWEKCYNFVIQQIR